MTALAPPATRSCRFTLWGGEATVAVEEPDRLDAALGAVRDVVEAFDRACSPFREDSDLTAVNRSGGAPVEVDPLFAEALATALDAAALTGGVVDPTIGGALLSLGLDAAPPAGASPQRGSGVRVRAIRVPGWETVELDADRRRVRVARGTQLDLGASAKALAADRAAARAADAAGCGVLVSLLGDLAIAGRAPAEGWAVRVTDDHRSAAGAAGQTIILRDGGLATSSRTVRHAAGDPERHHLIDPGSGRPAHGPWRTVSVHAASCLEANTVSTALMVAGPQALWLLDEGGLPARLVAHGGSVEHRHGWPQAGEGT